LVDQYLLMSKLLSPLCLKSVTLKNRMAISPMCQYSAVNGFANDWHLVHMGSRAVGGAGLIIQEATAVSPEGRITPGDLGLYEPGHIVKLKQITSFIREQGSVPGIQLAHAGRKASCSEPWKGGRQIHPGKGGWSTVAPSAHPFYATDEVSAVLDIVGIQKVVADFTTSAIRALESGYQLLDIHAAHGYLVHQFLSPLSNHRRDGYGGSFDNRIRLLLEILDGVQGVWPQDLPLFVRISATDWASDGWNPDEAVKLSAILMQRGVDLIDCSSGGLLPDVKIPVGPGFQVKFAERIRKETGILTSAVGLITDPLQAEEILERGAADLIMFGRESLREPYFPLKAAAELKDEIVWPPQYIRAKP
jgi:2,4-dienoyl-CoA reductase-like NADH-dependent reductase (Old Yellow Enzyme family)